MAVLAFLRADKEGHLRSKRVFEANPHTRLGELLAQLNQPFPEGFGRGINDDVGTVVGVGVNEAQIGGFIGTIQADDQVIGMGWNVHSDDVLMFFCAPADLTRRRQYRRVVFEKRPLE